MTTCTVTGKPHQADTGSFLCRPHLEGLADWLHDVEHEYGMLDARPSMQANWNGARGGKLASHTSPARISALVQADPRRVPIGHLTGPAGVDNMLSVYDTLHTWAQMIRDGRNLQTPGRWITEQVLPGPVCERCDHFSCRRLVSRYFARDRLTVTTERQLLSRHLEWAAGQAWIGELWADIRTLRGQLQAVNGTGEVRLGGICPHCGGPLHAVKPQHTTGSFVHVGDSLLQAVECEKDASHRWENTHLIRLALILEQQQQERVR